ncbi:protein REVERSION-TO-ETHYLENE SENSITIVITY1-like [Melia azedarach]|uniref:Protein REVERSION-TO-ETHYLENE SENSITIVITY1-like n=1 Tax=Melia azedarach TaxID=155640 RepID=A0ACC1X9Y5_MELAZ|nr:protein REVERSION-TO-ETHYLENE SENSITIVITY1-like [Melia azedarach]
MNKPLQQAEQKRQKRFFFSFFCSTDLDIFVFVDSTLCLSISCCFYREDGVILDFSGSSFVNVDGFAFGAAAIYLQLDRKQCCFPPNLSGHTCKHGYRHTEYGTALMWDDALQSSMRQFEHRTYNLFTCNSHSFVADCLNRLCYGGSMGWNMVNVAALILFKGHWINSMSILRSFLPFILVLCLGILLVGWPFLIGLFSFSFLLLGWFVLGTYFVKGLIEC